MAMKTLREMLDGCRFNWPAGRIIVAKESIGLDYFEARDTVRPLTDGLADNDPALDVKIDTGYGTCNIPPFIAEDDAAIYVVATYDGASWIERIEKNLDRYLAPKAPSLPCIGGG